VGQHVLHMIPGLLPRPDMDLRILAPRDQLDRKRQVPVGNPLAGIAVEPLPGDCRWLEAMWEHLNFPKIDRWSGTVDWVYSPPEGYIAVKRPRLAVTFISMAQRRTQSRHSPDARRSTFADRRTQLTFKPPPSARPQE